MKIALEIEIQKYQSSFRDDIRMLCCDTAFMGLPLEKAFCDRDFYADFNTNYYIKHEPDCCFVAADQTKFVGHLLGSKCLTKYALVMPFSVIPAIVKGAYRCMAGKYDEKSMRFIRWFFEEGYEQTPKMPFGAAHFHIDVKDAYRHAGIGGKLVECFEHHLQECGVKRCAVQVLFTGKLGAVPFYRKLGFKDYDCKIFTGFKGFLDDEVKHYTLVKEL